MSSNPETPPQAHSSPLADLHRRLGANMSPYRGVEAAADYGDEGAEGEALRSASGLLDRSWTSAIEMLGEDRSRFLGGYVTCDVTSLAPGGGAYGFITNVKGRVLADPVVLALDESLWLELPASKAQEISQHLGKYVIVDRVDIRPLDDWAALSLIGPRSAEVLGAAAEVPEATWSHREAEIAGTGIRLAREPAFEVRGRKIPAWTIWVPAAGAQACFERLIESGAGGLVPVGHRAFDSLRVEAGRPLYGIDFGGGNFPQETGLEEQAVSYTKGCYLGQEVVARIHYRGGVNRHLRGLVFPRRGTDGTTSRRGTNVGSDDSAGDDPVGRAVLTGGREAGIVTSTAVLEGGGRIGLAILHKRAEPDAEVDVADSGAARVIELPFPPE